MVHAPLLLGLDPAGAEHPQGPGDPDDEDLTGRVWGCTCGWRGTARDITARHFRPRVGDGGGLRRQRLARADRDARGELEAHLAASTPEPDPAPPAGAARSLVPAPPRAARAADRGDPRLVTAAPRVRRRRLTLPRPSPGAADDHAPTPTPDPGPGSGRPPENPDPAPAVPPPSPSAPATAETSAPGPPATSDQARPRAAGAALPAEQQDHAEREDHGGEDSTTGAASATAGPTGPDAAERILAAAADRTRAAREELAAAEHALEAAVTAAREQGASWRTIARLTGIPHREAAARFGEGAGGSSL